MPEHADECHEIGIGICFRVEGGGKLTNYIQVALRILEEGVGANLGQISISGGSWMREILKKLGGVVFHIWRFDQGKRLGAEINYLVIARGVESQV